MCLTRQDVEAKLTPNCITLVESDYTITNEGVCGYDKAFEGEYCRYLGDPFLMELSSIIPNKPDQVSLHPSFVVKEFIGCGLGETGSSLRAH